MCLQNMFFSSRSNLVQLWKFMRVRQLTTDVCIICCSHGAEIRCARKDVSPLISIAVITDTKAARWCFAYVRRHTAEDFPCYCLCSSVIT